ncbi:glycosyltransferase [Pseudomonas sp. HS-18]|uniref:glycosyltransferase n=1 Tax=Pseudomonas sp. HS-18 TaxID=2879114 RepID=UPI001CF04567|nr:glycosyltransferase [Pseudomonas sp. HS-18]UCL88107.1 glycosyltransferase [Pseudomonas sp. HS-18]
MKVWILAGRFKAGGLEQVLSTLAAFLTDQGIDTTLVARAFDQSPPQPGLRPYATRTLPGSSLVGFVAALAKTIRLDRPTHIITSANDIACLTVLLRLLFLRRSRVIVTQHLTVSPEVSRASGMRKLKLKLIRHAMRALYPRADRVIAVSDGVAEDLAQQLNLPRAAIATIYNPVVDAQMARRIEAPLPTGFPWASRTAPLVAFAGRLEPVKRVDLLLEAFAQVHSQTGARLLILGEGSLLDELKRHAARLQVTEDVLFFGHAPNILPLLKSSDVLVLPSDYEGFGNVLVEAMACGTQVIATDCPSGPAEILEHGRYGQLIPTNSAPALIEALSKTLGKEFEVPADTLRWRAGHFSVERAGKAYLEILRETQS